MYVKYVELGFVWMVMTNATIRCIMGSALQRQCDWIKCHGQKSACLKTDTQLTHGSLAAWKLWLHLTDRCEAVTALTSGYVIIQTRTLRQTSYKRNCCLSTVLESRKNSNELPERHRITRKSNHSPEGFPRNRSRKDRISSTGVPSTIRGKQQDLRSSSTQKQVNKQNLYFAGNWLS